MTVAGYFLRGKRQLSLMLSEPGVELGCKIIVYCGGGLMLAAIPALGGPVPLAAALASLSDQVRIVPVADDESGTCIIEMPDEIIDASASTQLSNIRGIVADVPADAPRQEFEIRGGGPDHVPQYDSTGL